MDEVKLFKHLKAVIIANNITPDNIKEKVSILREAMKQYAISIGMSSLITLSDTEIDNKILEYFEKYKNSEKSDGYTYILKFVLIFIVVTGVIIFNNIIVFGK